MYDYRIDQEEDCKAGYEGAQIELGPENNTADNACIRVSFQEGKVLSVRRALSAKYKIEMRRQDVRY